MSVSTAKTPCFLPKSDVIIAELTDGRLSEDVGAGELIRYDAESAGAESLGLGYHAPEQMCGHILLEIFLAVRHCHELDGMSMERCLVVGTLADEIVVYGQVRGSSEVGITGRSAMIS